MVDVVEQIEVLDGHRVAIGAELQVDKAVLRLVQLDVCVCEEVNDLLADGHEAVACLFLQKAHQHRRPLAHDLPFLGFVQLADIVVSAWLSTRTAPTSGWQTKS